MARRSAMNERYRKDAQIGKTRRSAASAKPKRAAGEVAARGAAKPKGGGKGARVPFDPPEARPWRLRWWVFIALALLSAATAFIPQVRANASLQRASLAIEVGALVAALYIDFFIIRKIRREALAADKSGGKPAAKEPVEPAGNEGRDEDVVADEITVVARLRRLFGRKDTS
ncbi:MAG: hypothetical protein C0418_01755 [Coriobacteriaceae bacterium]|nr:hypothetical protein [Coriobacteriaceae bacterium]